jgi:putative ATP-dependent endonuclease of OLD family
MKDEGGAVKVFPSEQWTLEFDLARISAFAVFVHQAIQVAKGRPDKTDAEVAAEAQAEVTALQADDSKSVDDVAVFIFEPLFKKQVSKAMVAEQLAALIDALPDTPTEFRAKLPPYIVNAIDHVTTFEDTASSNVEAPAPETPASAS